MFSDPEHRRCNDLNEPGHDVPFTGLKEDASARTGRHHFTVGGNIIPYGKFESGYSS